jgi:hypothetical protein
MWDESSENGQFLVAIQMNYRVLTDSMEPNYAEGHELWSNILFQCIMNILWVFVHIIRESWP